MRPDSLTPAQLDELQTELGAVPDVRADPGVTFADLFAGAVRADRLVVDVWVFDTALAETVLVRHPRRGWVMPGGKLEPGEPFRAAGVRELHEETGILVAPQDLRPAGAYLGTDPDSPGVDVGLSFSTIVGHGSLRSEPGQTAEWWRLDDDWFSIYPHDRQRLIAERDRYRR